MTKATVKVEYEGDDLTMAVNDEGYIVLRAAGGISDARFVKPTLWEKAAPWVFGLSMLGCLFIAVADALIGDFSRAAFCGVMACIDAVFFNGCIERLPRSVA